MGWDEKLDKGSVAYKIAAAADARIRVIAGPGTGKSFAMKRRVARLLEEGVDPKHILAVTFTRVAAEDLHRELQKLEVPGAEALSGQTLHSLALRVLCRKHVLGALGRTARPLNRFELATLICDLSDAHGGKRACRKLIQAYEAAWAQSQGDQPGFPNSEEEKHFQTDLLDWLRFHRAMLIGEVIPYLVRYLKENPAAPEHAEYKHLLIDEYQDLNVAEQTALEYLGKNADVCVVGDDDQSIYSFKHAHPDGIREWKNNNPGCEDLQMADCHRCPTTVVAMANALISKNTGREPRELTPINAKGSGKVRIVQLPNLEEEAIWIAKEVADILAAGADPSEIIVLVQRSVAGTPILKALQAADVPAKSYYDESQLETGSAQERFALLKLLLDQEDRVALRYLLGAGTHDFRAKPYSRLRKECETTGDSPWVTLEKLSSGALSIPHTGSLVTAYKQIQSDLHKLAEAAQLGLPTLIDELLPEGLPELAELRSLALATSDGLTTPQELLSAMMEELTQPDIPPTVEEVRVMSLHKSKGLSSPFVIIAGCVQGILPATPDASTPEATKKAMLEEARRLFYVGITRVKADPDQNRVGTLYLTYSQKMEAGKAYGANISFASKSGKYANLIPSEFISELGPAAPHPESG